MSELVVVDTNLVISALISGNEEIFRTLSSPETTFVTTKILVVELFEHAPRIQEKTRLSRVNLLDLLNIILGHIDFLDDGLISGGSWVEAARLCRDVDMDDIAFVALTLEMEGRLWTRDNRLRTHLVRNGFSNFFDI